MAKPNVLYIMTDQFRFDAIASLGNDHIYTPSLDRLARRGVSFTNAYTSCPVCVAARYNIRTGCEPPTNGVFRNGGEDLVEGQPEEMEARCGPFLARRMSQLGYRSFGIGKFHSRHADMGYDDLQRAEELFGNPESRAVDAFAAFIAREHPQFDFVEQLHGERTEMYYMPQTSPLPADITYEAWAASCAVEQLQVEDDRPYFGFVSLIGPHPPLAPPIPYNRMYDPDCMPDPVCGDIAVDHMDEQIPWMNHAIWADDISPARARSLKARYYGEVTYIDHCVGRILDTAEARADGDDTLIAFFSDHGEMLGDHGAWQKECYFDGSCRIPFLVSWPARLPRDQRCADLVCLTDLFAIATGAAGEAEVREGTDVLGVIAGDESPRESYAGYYGSPGTRDFKIMVRSGEWKYIYLANGGREQLFNLEEDPRELRNRAADAPQKARLRELAVAAVDRTNADRALEAGELKQFAFEARPLKRIYQMDGSRGVKGFPQRPEDVVFDTGNTGGA